MRYCGYGFPHRSCGLLGLIWLILAETTFAQNTPPGLTLEEAFKQGKEYYSEKHFGEAKNFFSFCVDQEPRNSEYLCWLAQTMAFVLAERAMRGASTLALIPDGETIRDLYTKALEYNPKSERARIGNAILLRDVPGWLGGNPAKAEKILLEVLKDNPTNIFALHSLGFYYIKIKKDYPSGITYLERALQEGEHRALSAEEQMKLANTYHALGLAYRDNLKDPVKAAQYFQKSLVIDPDSVVALMDLAKAYRESNQLEPARETLRKAARIVKSNQYKRFQRELALEARKLKISDELG